jgi:hypothetical protein
MRKKKIRKKTLIHNYSCPALESCIATHSADRFERTVSPGKMVTPIGVRRNVSQHPKHAGIRPFYDPG